MKILVTGYQGYIGPVLVSYLQKNGFDVTGLDTSYFDTCILGGEVPHIPHIHKDVRDVEPSDLEGFDGIIHLAALSNDPLCDLNPDLTYEVNHRASVRIAQMAKEVGVQRFVFASSCSTYGAAGDGLINEEGTLNPVTAYGESKVFVERDVKGLADANFTPTFLRCATAYGASPRLRFGVVLNSLVAWAYTTGRIYMMSDGTPWRPIVHIEDISRAFVSVLNAPSEIVSGEAFNVGQNKENYRISELAEIVHEVVPNSHIEYAADAGPDKRTYRVDFSKIANILPDFKPQWDAKKGAQELYEMYERVGLTLADLEGPNYLRLRYIRKLLDEQKLDNNLRWQVEKEGMPS